LALLAGVAGILGFWLARRVRPKATSPAAGVGVAATTSAAGLVLAFVMRYGMQSLPFILQQVRAARQRPEARVGAAVAKSPATGYTATHVLH
jgi:hypothetical protein